MADLYLIANWDENFENKETRKLQRLRYVLLPTDLDKDGYVELIDHKNGPAHFGIWIALVELAAKDRKPRTGALIRSNGEPHTFYTMSRLTRIPERTIELAVERLCSKSIGWMKLEQSPLFSGEGGDQGEITGEKTPLEKEGDRDKEGEGESRQALAVAEYLRDAILSHSPDHRCGKNGEHSKWTEQIGYSLRLDGRTPAALRAAVDFAHRRDHETFWRPNIQSGKKLREKFDVLQAQYRGEQE